ncbi:HAD hydrolase-like protein [Globicatella sp. PHS-GS-PNBC-21-1553]|uniref:HAD hydrolase-like protein n=1 Tax=Globicatella sp. PHS-GS-PNBC-21-1553 TaxID=2885764 RepID=UPI00298F251E|nr:HAD hydrolase-like protein [Globicatella sp. PHS-GS-PNBC-21-1553]
MIKVVLFDLDDTLISEEQYILSGYYEVSNLLSKKFLIDHNEVYRIMIDYYNKGSKKVFNEVLEYFNIKYNENIINELIDTYRNHSPKIELLEDSKGILSYLLKSRKK